MCTVTYIPTGKDNFVLTSNRDVSFSREKAIFPKDYEENKVKITYPKDGKAGGTWIGYSDKKRLICLLNGGFENHMTNQNIFYRKSRGIVVLDLLKENNIIFALDTIDLDKIEPFTLVIADWNDRLQLIEFVWDGTVKHLKKLPQKKHIWSSSTLYNNETKRLREDWFGNWNLQSNENVLNFHHQAGNGDTNVNVILKREKIGTVSITQVVKQVNNITMNYEEVKREMPKKQ